MNSLFQVTKYKLLEFFIDNLFNNFMKNFMKLPDIHIGQKFKQIIIKGSGKPTSFFYDCTILKIDSKIHFDCLFMDDVEIKYRGDIIISFLLEDMKYMEFIS